MKKKPVALFDLDGVIIDTETQYSYFWANVASHLIPDVENFSQRIKGHTLKQIYALFFPDEKIQQELTRLVAEFESEMKYEFIPGVETFIRELKREGIPMAIVTSSDEPKMAQVYKAQPQLKEQFDYIVTSEHITQSKPHPECYLFAAQQLNVAPEDCVVFEDSKAGLTAGNAAGARVIGLSTTCPAHEIAPLSHLVIPNFDQFTVSEFVDFFENI